MPTKPGSLHNPFLQLWLQALASPNGVGIKLREGQDVSRAKSLLYSARNRSGNPALSSLGIRSRPTNPHQELWIIHTGEPDAQET